MRGEIAGRIVIGKVNFDRDNIQTRELSYDNQMGDEVEVSESCQRDSLLGNRFETVFDSISNDFEVRRISLIDDAAVANARAVTARPNWIPKSTSPSSRMMTRHRWIVFRA
jgi:hypothetical protein